MKRRERKEGEERREGEEEKKGQERKIWGDVQVEKGLFSQAWWPKGLSLPPPLSPPLGRPTFPRDSWQKFDSFFPKNCFVPKGPWGSNPRTN